MPFFDEKQNAYNCTKWHIYTVSLGYFFHFVKKFPVSLCQS